MHNKYIVALIISTLAACQPAARPPAVQHAPGAAPSSAPAARSGPAPHAGAAQTPAPDGEPREGLFVASAADALAVEESDGSGSLRSRLHLAKMEPDMVLVELTSRLAGQAFPACPFVAKVLKEAASKKRHLRLLGRGRTYHFVPALSARADGQPDLSDPATRANLGACYYAPGTKLVIRVGGVQRASKTFAAAAIFLK